MPESKPIVIEVVGEGKTDIGPTTPEPKAEPPAAGVVPVLLHRLCGEPASMRVKRRKVAFLQGKGLEQKVRFSKRQAPYNGSAGIVFVLDTEGDLLGQIEQLARGCGAVAHDFPTAVGVAHPCIEAWLLADPRAIVRALATNPLAHDLPEQPEDLPAPRADRENNPKTVLARCAGRANPLATAETTAIALHLHMETARTGCPKSFAPFAVEVETHIRPIFAG